MVNKVQKGIALFFFYISSRLIMIFTKLDNDKILLLSDTHGELDGNLKEIYDFLQKKRYEPRYYLKKSRRERMKLKEFCSLIYDMTTAKNIFLDDYYLMTSAMRVRAGQNLVQLWHGAGAFKKFGYSRLDTEDGVKNIHSGYKKYTHVPVSSEDIIPCYAEAFGISEEKVLPIGVPRTDFFFREKDIREKEKAFYKKYPELSDKKLVLIAPTYRGSKINEANYDIEKLDLPRVQKSLGNEYALGVKWHRAILDNIENGKIAIELPEGCYDFSEFNDVEELLPIADVLITDYSSVIFDYSILSKPIIFFPYDYDEYKINRGLYFEFNEYVYGEIANDCESLIEYIKKGNLCPEKRKDFIDKFMKACDGKSCERLYEILFKGDQNNNCD